MNPKQAHSRTRRYLIVSSIMYGFYIAACSSPPRVEFEPHRPTSVRPTRQPTPTSASTATPTAAPVVVRDTRPIIPQSPNPLGLVTHCGVADYFDYPLDPPDAILVTGGQDFGNFRDRYEGYHTGEDWWYERRDSLGKPIYSIGEGRVRYAAPYGWGDDLGTLVIEHILPNGRHLYSFYGHVDPDSLTLRAGQCVEKGQQIGEIGDPRSSPHLHFEIRTIFANGPGPGYWSIDPAKSGWLPPSETIEFSRYEANEIVNWSRAMEISRHQSLGWLNETIILQQEDSDLVVVDTGTGEAIMRQPLEGMGILAAWDPRSELIYLADGNGTIHAHLFADSDQVDVPYTFEEEAMWSVTVGGSGPVQVIPLTDGVVVLRRNLWSAFNARGEPLWQVEPGSMLVDWIAIDGGALAVTGGERGDLWTWTEDGALAWEIDQSGILFNIRDQLFLYAKDQLLELSPATFGISPYFSWSAAQVSGADLLGLEGGGIILLHKDVFDQRLLQIGKDGGLVWERSIHALEADRAQLIDCSGEILMLIEQDHRSKVQVDLFRVDQNGNGDLIFQTSIREKFVSESWMTCVGDTALLLSLGGRRMVQIDLSRD